MSKEKYSEEKCWPIFQLIERQVKNVASCLCPFSDDINFSFFQREKLKNSLEEAHGTISNFLLEFDHPEQIKDQLIKILENLLSAAEYLSFSSIGGGYNVMYDIYHTIRLSKKLA